jgi:hypothetical protein
MKKRALDYALKVRLPITAIVIAMSFAITYYVSRAERDGVGYAPEQPIAYSHKLHAGEMQIDCQYCHTGVEKSRHAMVPPTETCMNCHKIVNKSPDQIERMELGVKLAKSYHDIEGVFHNNDIEKKFDEQLEIIYRATNSEKEAFVEEFGAEYANLYSSINRLMGTNLLVQSIKSFFKENGQPRNAKLAKKIEEMSHDHEKMETEERDIKKWSEIAKILDYYEKGEPIPWKRVHQVPDYAYFNHSVHVNKGIDCSNCHGAIEKMEVVQQVHSFTMGNCLSCHRNAHERMPEIADQIKKGPENCNACHR